MTERFAKNQLRLMKYAFFIGIVGGITSFIGSAHHGLIKAMIGCVVGCMLLGQKLPKALKELFEANSEMIDNIFGE